MSVIVTDTGFAPDTWEGDMLVLPPDTLPDDIGRQIGGHRLICVEFPSFADGRGFTLARQVRLLGYTGRLRARGHLIADQYAMARRSGFDEVEIDDTLAARQPQDQWLQRVNWRDHDYRSRLRQAV